MSDKDEILAKFGDTFRKAAEHEDLAHSIIGQAACDLLAKQKNVSAQDLIAHFEEKIGQSSSAKGKGKPELDLARVRWEGAISILTSLGDA